MIDALAAELPGQTAPVGARRTRNDRRIACIVMRGLIVTAANDGAAAHPAWYLNLKAAPEAQVEVNGRKLDVCAEELRSDEATGWWARIVARAPDYERYARATGRTIPVIRLVPVSTPA